MLNDKHIDQYADCLIQDTSLTEEYRRLIPNTINVSDGSDFKIFEYIEWKMAEKYIINYYSLFPNRQSKIPTADIKVMFHLTENHFSDKNEANVRANMLIHLIENKLIEVNNEH